MLFLPLGELSFYKAFFSDRVYEVSSPPSSAAGDPNDSYVTQIPIYR